MPRSAAVLAGLAAILVAAAVAVSSATASSRRALAGPAPPGAIFNGLGFDACAAPSTKAMAAWGTSSPYAAIGIYIGGVNRACAQPNLSALWVSQESQAGWHLIPLYVGLQPPSNTCRCASMSANPDTAGAQGAAAAADAVAQAQALGIGLGNPIYYDMEHYDRATDSGTVLAFLSAWTAGLHAAGYVSGVYGDVSSTVSDLVSVYGTGYLEPDDVFFARYDGLQAVTDPVLPPLAWPNGQLLHQYAGGHNETWGGVTINVDNDFLDGATAAAGSVPPVTTTAPVATAAPGVAGTPLVGQTLTETAAAWSGSPTAFSYQWERCNAAGAACTAIPGATAQTYTLSAADRGRTIRVAEGAANAVGSGSPATSAQTAAIHKTATGYWTFTAEGEVYNSLYRPALGEPVTAGVPGGTKFAGMAAMPGGRGYWLVTRQGTVYRFGAAPQLPAVRVRYPVAGILADPAGGYWLFTAKGNVYTPNHSSFLGSLARKQTAPIIGMAATRSGRGYWLLAKNGVVYAFGNARQLPRIRKPGPYAGIVSDPHGGYWVFTTTGRVYRSKGTPWYGSPATQGVHLDSFTGMVGTPDGRGYWLTTSQGVVSSFGDAGNFPPPAPAHAIKGIVGAGR